MDIIKTLENCIIALGGMRPRVDQPEIFNTASALIRALNDCRSEAMRLLDALAGKEKAGADAPEAAEAAEEG